MEPTLSIDEIRLWNVKQLKNFLRKRGLKVSGRKDELVALVFAAMRLPGYCKIQEDASSAKLRHYKDLLIIDGQKIPDPLEISGWRTEVDSITNWPPTMTFEISNYLNNIDEIPLKKRLISDYKDGKSYSYFASGWLGKVQFHHINDSSKVCFLRAECRPSQNISNIPWKVWVCIEKKSGEIRGAYCTCFAG